MCLSFLTLQVLHIITQATMTLYFSEETYPQVLHWLEHVQENYYNDPQYHLQIPAKLLPRAVRDEGKPVEDPKYPVINHLNAKIQGLLDTSSNMRHVQYVRALMESADLMSHEHPFLAKLRKFARDRRRPLHRAWKLKPDVSLLMDESM
jgi:hypothetical protein